MALAAGEKVPEFRLLTGEGSEFTREDLADATTVLVFYPFAFSPVCTDQLQIYEGALADFAAKDVVLFGVSCDSTYAQTAFAEKLGITSGQLSDFEPKGAACRAFDTYHPGGFPQRALVITGRDATVLWSYQADSPGELPSLELLRQGVDAALAAAA
ncbi:MAG TPA: redoxin domain-containing protein [Solirubrobacteraceae bacterium]|nr:redoxin domain-containing protein [Solirubrobacteraceae bacterium]